MDFFSKLPEELWLQVMRHLSWIDILSLRGLNSNFWRLLQDKSLKGALAWVSHDTKPPSRLQIDELSLTVKENELDIKVAEQIDLEDLFSQVSQNGSQEITHLKVTNGVIHSMEKLIESLPMYLTKLELINCNLPPSLHLQPLNVLPDRLPRTFRKKSQRPTLSKFKIVNSQPGYLVKRLWATDIFWLMYVTPRPFDLHILKDEDVLLHQSWEDNDWFMEKAVAWMKVLANEGLNRWTGVELAEKGGRRCLTLFVGGEDNLKMVN